METGGGGGREINSKNRGSELARVVRELRINRSREEVTITFHVFD